MNIKNNLLALSIVAVVFIISFVSFWHSRISSNTLRQKLLAIENDLPTEAGKRNFLKQSHNLTASVAPELVDLDGQIITCSPNIDSLLSSSPSFGGSCIASERTISSVQGKYLVGQCCSALIDTKEYHEHLEKLQAYKSLPNIPLDPMHTPIDLAKKWIDYDHRTTLKLGEQKIYDQVYAMSKEKPCCCKCWHYFVNEGIAKKMIKTGQFNSKEIADYWDNSDICGS